MPSISIALATMNGEKYIGELLESLVRQKTLPLEVVVCDDSSTDSTLRIVEEFARAAPFKVALHINEKRLGYRANFMKAASLCSGDVIAFCDQDDIWHEEKLTKVATTFASNSNVMMFHHNADLINGAGAPLGRNLYSEEKPSESFAAGTNVPWDYPLGFTQAFRRELISYSEARLGTVDPFKPEECLAHDQWIPILATCTGLRYYSSDILVSYRQHGSNLYGAWKEERQNRWDKLVEKFLRYSDYRLLERVCSTLSESLRSCELAAGSNLFAQAATAYRFRVSIYSSTSFLLRLKAWSAARRQGIYDRRKGVYFARRSALKDFLSGIILARLTKPPSTHVNDWDDTVVFAGIEAA